MSTSFFAASIKAYLGVGAVTWLFDTDIDIWNDLILYHIYSFISI